MFEAELHISTPYTRLIDADTDMKPPGEQPPIQMASAHVCEVLVRQGEKGKEKDSKESEGEAMPGYEYE